MADSGGRASRRVAAALLVLALAAPPARAQSLLETTPDMRGVEVPSPRAASFTFTHRFKRVGEESAKVVNYPSFRVAVGLPASFAVGATYASNSEVGGGTPNEWELWIRRRFGGARAAGAATVAWNTAVESADAELSAGFAWGRLRLLAAARGFTNAYGEDDAAAALAGGAAWRLTPRLALAADVAGVVTGERPPAAWSAGLVMAIPGTPHTLALTVSNVGAPTFQGASRGIEDSDGGDDLRYGFAFTAPLGTFGQWARIFRGEAAREPGQIVIRDFRFVPGGIRVRAGETVMWVNDDTNVHTVTAVDGSFDSGPIAPGEGYSRRFEDPGRYAYHCTPHPFMKGVVVVEPQ